MMALEAQFDAAIAVSHACHFALNPSGRQHRPLRPPLGGTHMAHLEHPGNGRTLPPELALLILLAVFGMGLVMAWPWTW